MVREVKRILMQGPCTLTRIAAGLPGGRELARAAVAGPAVYRWVSDQWISE